MKGQKIAIVAAVAAAVLLCLGGAWIVWKAFAKAGEVKVSRNEELKQLQSIYRKDPFPSPTNVVVVRSDRVRLEGWTQALGRELQGGEPVTPTNGPISPSLFIQQLQRAARELRDPALAGGAKVLPDNFAFGFDQYLAVGATMPRPEDVPRLALQLRMVNALLREILAARVSSVSQVEREVFEAGATAAAAPVGFGHRAHALAAAPAAAAAAAGPYARQHFTFAFAANEKSLDDVLNRLAAMPLFAVVTDLETHREERGLRPPPAAPTAAPAPAAASSAAAPAAAPPKASPPSAREQRIASGPQVAPVLRVQMQIDAYTFEGV